VSNSISHFEGVREKGAKEVAWAKWVKAKGEWRKLHNEQLNDLYSSPNIIRLIKSRRTCWAACTGKRRGAYRILVEKPEGKRPL
jgi:hypothetical protein